MPRSEKNSKSTRPNDISIKQTEGINKKRPSREYSKRKRMSRMYYRKNTNGKVGKRMIEKKDIIYSNYVKVLDHDGNSFCDDMYNAKEHGEGENGPQELKTCAVRFKKDAKLVLQRLLITWLRRICNVFKTICNLEGLSKIKEKTVYTQIRLSYPPSDQKFIMAFCKKALKSYIDSSTSLVHDTTITTTTTTTTPKTTSSTTITEAI